MPSPWEDRAERARVEQRAHSRARRRGVGAALLREIAREAGEPFMGIFLVSDGVKVVDLVAAFQDWPPLLSPGDRRQIEWLLERRVEDELLRRARRGFDGIESIASACGSPLVVRPVAVRY